MSDALVVDEAPQADAPAVLCRFSRSTAACVFCWSRQSSTYQAPPAQWILCVRLQRTPYCSRIIAALSVLPKPLDDFGVDVTVSNAVQLEDDL